MSNEEIQSIIAQATRQRAANEAQVQEHQVEEALEDTNVTPSEPVQEATHLGENDIDALVSEMTLGQSTEEAPQELDLDAEEDADMENFIADHGLTVHRPAIEETSPNESEATIEDVPFPAAEISPTFADPSASDNVAPSEAQEHPEAPQEEDAETLTPEEYLERSIPAELDTAEQRESTSRFSGAEWFKTASLLRITLAGVGGIGSWAALLLAKLHPAYIYLWDPDTVDFVNLAGQLYNHDQIGLYKALASASTMATFADYYDTSAHTNLFTESSPATDIMISGFDNMGARRTYFNRWKQHVSTSEQKEKCLYIDARMSAENIQILCMTGDSAYMREYEERWLFSDEEADSTVCSYKQTAFCAAIIGGLITNLVVNFCTNLGTPLVDRTLPFLTSYDASTMLLNVRN